MKQKIIVLSKTLITIVLTLGLIQFSVLASNSENMFAPDVMIDDLIVPTELKMELNCTWSTEIVLWNTSALPPLPGSGWADEIVSITVTTEQNIELYITDYLLKGDYFEVYKVDEIPPTQAALIGTTPQVPVVHGTVSDPDIAYDDPTYSSAVFIVHLGPGKHYFAFREVSHAYIATGFRVKLCPGPPFVGGELLPLNNVRIYAIPLMVIISLAILLRKSYSFKN